MADIVTRMPAPASNSARLTSASAGGVVQRPCAGCEEESKALTVQRREAGADTPQVTPAVAASVNALRGGGSPLPASTREFFEPRFGADFSQVRLHTGTRAADTAKSINAKAFTLGRDIAFSAGQYAPESPEGQHLLAHELAHVVQQDGEHMQRARTQAREGAATGRPPSVRGGGPLNFLSASPLIQQKKNKPGKPTVLPDTEVRVSVRQLPKGVSPANFIAQQVQFLIDIQQGFWQAYRDGLQQFMNTMSFGEESTADSDLLSTTFIGVMEGIIDTMIAAVPNPYLQALSAAMKETAFAFGDKFKEQQKAKGAAKIVVYVNSLIDGADKGSKQDLAHLQQKVEPLQKQYWTLDPSNQQDAMPSGEAGVVFGPFASFLNDLARMVTHAREKLPSARSFQQRFSERFATTGGYSAPISQGGRPSGRLYLNVKVNAGTKPTAVIDRAWTLTTDAPERGRLATSLKESLHAEGRKVVETDLPKWVKLWVITERDWEFDRHDHGLITFGYDIDNFDVRSADHKVVIDSFKLFKHDILAVDDVKAGD
jgi:hypothetical protein